MSVLLITKSYTFLFYSHCYLLQNIYGMWEKNIFTLSTALTLLLDRSFPWSEILSKQSTDVTCQKSRNWHLLCTHSALCQLSSSAGHQGCQEALEWVEAAWDTHPCPQSPLSWAEVKGAEDLAKGHQLMRLPPLRAPRVSPAPSRASPHPQQHFVQHTANPLPNKSHLGNQHEIQFSQRNTWLSCSSARGT